METFVVTVFAKPGHEEDVATFYRELEELNDQAEGFHGADAIGIVDGFHRDFFQVTFGNGDCLMPNQRVRTGAGGAG